jgi:hypothetical protein
MGREAPSERRVVHEREAMTQQGQMTTAKAAPPTDSSDSSGARLGLTRAEAHALRRSVPLTPSQFKELRRLAEHGVNPLRHI